MRIRALFVLLAFVLLAASTVVSQQVNANVPKSAAPANVTPLTTGRFSTNKVLQVHKAPPWAGDFAPTCLAIRRYRMKKEAPDSDVTRLVGYTTCVPTRNITIMNADAH